VSLRARLALLVALAVAFGVALVAVAAYITVGTQLRAQLDAGLLGRAEAAVNSPLADPNLLVNVPAAALGAGDIEIAAVTANGVQVSPAGATKPPLGAPELAVAQGKSSKSIRTGTDSSGDEVRVVAVPVNCRGGCALVLAQSTEQLHRTLDRLALVLLLVGVVGVGLAALAGLAVASAGLRPVERLTKAAEHVSQTGIPEPLDIPEGPPQDELARLATTFNTMLAALAESRDQQRRLVEDAGHELRTPLTSLRTNLDLLAQSDAAGAAGGRTLDPADRAALLDDVRAQVEELGDLVGDVVELARQDSPESVAESVDLAEVVDRAVTRVRRRAPAVTFAVRADPWPMVGDAALLERAVTNLLDNAARWSPEGSTVTVELHAGRLTVADEGPGIADSDLPHVFERFYRSPSARATSGSGLGLAIVRQAAERHGGAVAAGRTPSGGALVTFAVPGIPWAPPPASPPAGVPQS
jgi:two-component system, OmpR family, sensor histidine kinase MprB